MFIILSIPLINRNMRCIEISLAGYKSMGVYWLIETWDVLKSQKSQKPIQTNTD